MSSTKSMLLCLALVASLLLAAEGLPEPNRGSYSSHSAGAAGGGYAHTKGGSYSNNKGHNGGFNGPPRGGYSSGHSSGGFEAEGGFVAGGGSVSGGYNKGYNSGHRG